MAGPTRRAVLAGAVGLGLARPAAAQTNGIVVSDVQIPAGNDTLAASVARPPGDGPAPLVLVAENGAGLDELVTDALRRLAKGGFLAVAPTLFAGDPPDGTVLDRIAAARDWALAHRGDPARVGLVGFGSGARATWLYAAHDPALKAAIAWYAPLGGPISPAHPQTALDVAGQLHAPLLGLYGKNDGTPQRVLLEAESKAKAAGKRVEMVQYVGAGSSFAAPGATFDQAATLDGWQRTVAWLRTNGVS